MRADPSQRGSIRMGQLLGVAIGTLVAIVVAVLGFTSNQEVTGIFDRSLRDSREIAVDNVSRFTELLAANTAVTVQPAVLDHNYSYISSVLTDMTRTDPSLLYLAVFDADGTLIDERGKRPAAGDGAMTAAAPITAQLETVGRVELVYGLATVESRIADAQKQNENRRSTSIRNLLIAGGLILGFGIFIALAFGVWLSRPVARMAVAAAELGEGKFDVRVDVGGPTEIRQLATTFNSMASELKASVETSIEQAALEREVGTARRLQREMMPSEDRITKGNLEIVSWYAPTGKMGGDWWTVSEGKPDAPVNIMIGDVMGHGIPAALFTAAAKSAYRTAAVLGVDKRPDELLATIDTALRDFSNTHTMSCAALRLDLASNQLVLSMGAHPAPLLFRPQRGKPSMDVLQGEGPLLGDSNPVGTFGCTTYGFEPGDLIALFTDGLVEAEDERGRMYGLRRIGATISEHFDDDLPTILDALKESLFGYVNDSEVDDDVTVVLIRYLPTEDRAEG